MTPRKPRTEVSLPTPTKLVPYPPASIWKTKDEGASFEFRGNAFVRRGNSVTHIPAVSAEQEERKSSGE